MERAVETVKATVNGVVYDLAYNAASGKWEAIVTAPSQSSYGQEDHTYHISLEAKDNAGNTERIDASDESLGEDLRLQVVEKTPPTLEIQKPGAEAVLMDTQPTFEIFMTDLDSGVDGDSLELTLDGEVQTSGMTQSADETGITVTFQPTTALQEGAHVLRAVVLDHDGNQMAKKRTFTIDVQGPALDVRVPKQGSITNLSTGEVSGVAQGSGLTTVTIAVNQEQSQVTLNPDGSFEKTVNYQEGKNEILITTTDDAGRTTTIRREVTCKTDMPAFSQCSLRPNPVETGAAYRIEVVFA